MVGPHAKRWWLSSRTHLSGYQRYRCFPSVGLLGPSLLFAWQRERLIWLRRGLFFACNTVCVCVYIYIYIYIYIYRSCSGMTCIIQFEHTHMHVYAWIPPIESKWLVNETSWTDLALCGELVYDFWRTRHINVVKWYSNMHAYARITSIHMHVVVAFEWYTPSCGYRRQAYIFVGPRGHPWSPWPTTR